MKKTIRSLFTAALALAAIFTAGSAWSETTPLLLINVNGTATGGAWIDIGADGPANIAVAASQDTSNVGFATSGSGGYWWKNNPSVDYATTSEGFIDVYGVGHNTFAEEVKASLGLTENIPSTVYLTGSRNGQAQPRTGTISGLDPTKRYVVYIGIGTSDAGNRFKIQSSGYSSCELREYVTSVAGTNAGTINQYTIFNENTQIGPGSNGAMTIRLTGVVPTTNGTIVFALENNWYELACGWGASAEAN